MKNRIASISPITSFVIIGLIAAAVAFGIVRYGMGSDQGTVGAQARCETRCVLLRQDGASPDEIALKVGESLEFASADGQTHNIGLGGGDTSNHEHTDHAVVHEHSGSFESGDFGADEAWRVQFAQAGTYEFHDHYNPKQNVLVVVYQAKEE